MMESAQTAGFFCLLVLLVLFYGLAKWASKCQDYRASTIEWINLSTILTSRRFPVECTKSLLRDVTRAGYWLFCILSLLIFQFFSIFFKLFSTFFQLFFNFFSTFVQLCSTLFNFVQLVQLVLCFKNFSLFALLFLTNKAKREGSKMDVRGTCGG